jgi:hypothetical protein
MCLWARYKKKYEIKIIFFASLKSLNKGVGSRVGSGSISQRYRTDPGIRIRIKMALLRAVWATLSE